MLITETPNSHMTKDIFKPSFISSAFFFPCSILHLYNIPPSLQKLNKFLSEIILTALAVYMPLWFVSRNNTSQTVN